MRRVILIAALAISCTPREARTEAEIEACYAAVQAQMLAKVRAECPSGPYAACPAYDTLNAEWAAKAERCR